MLGIPSLQQHLLNPHSHAMRKISLPQHGISV